MKRWLSSLGAVLILTGISTAQTPIDRPPRPGYLIVRVILDSTGAGGAAAGFPGGGFPGGGGLPGEGGPGGLPGGGLPGGGLPGGGLPGGDAGGGFPGSFGGGFGGQQGPQQVQAARSVVAVIPYNQAQLRRFNPNSSGNPITNPTSFAITHSLTRTGRPNGVTFLFSDKTSIQFFPRIPFSFEQQVRSAHDKWRTNRKFDEGYDLVTTALSYGMVEEAQVYAKELLDLIDVRKELTPPAKVLNFQKVYKEIGPKLDSPPPLPDDAELWKDRLQASAIGQGLHYAMLYWGERQINPEEINRRLRVLEQNFKAFYLWHALNGIPVQLPQKRMVVILADRGTDIPRLHQALDGNPIVTDGFYSQQHDILVLSPEPLDEASRSFTSLVQAQYQVGWNRDDLLEGKIPDPRTNPRSANEIARISTLSLVDKVLEHQSDISTISREGCRQLYVNSGIFALNVKLPEWVESGSVSFFHRPKGQVFTQSSSGSTGFGGGQSGGLTMTVGLVTGYGSANFAMHRYFKDFVQKRELNPAPEVLLKNVLTDKYFEAMREGKEIDPTAPGAGSGNDAPPPGAGPMGPGRGAGPAAGPGGVGAPGGLPGDEIGGSRGAPPAPGGATGGIGGQLPDESPAGKRRLREKLTNKAHSTAWALTYYLNRTRSAGMEKFYAELKRMPRDMQIGETPILMTFGKCFNLLNQDGTALDEAAFKQLASDWVLYMKNVPATGLDLPIDATTADPSATGQDPSAGFGFGPGGGMPGQGLPGGGSGS